MKLLPKATNRTFTHCEVCKGQFVSMKTGQALPYKSKYPLCMPCHQKGMVSVEFQKYIKKILYAKSHGRYNSAPNIAPKS